MQEALGLSAGGSMLMSGGTVDGGAMYGGVEVRPGVGLGS